MLFAAFILPVFLRNRLLTVTEYLERRFDRRTRITYSAFTLITLLLVDTAGALYAGAVAIQTGFPSIEPDYRLLSVLLLTAIVGMLLLLS